MRTLHIDTGREMRGGQWQVLYLLEHLKDATLLARRDSPLFAAATRKGIPVEQLSFPVLYKIARKVDLVHAHDARAHTLAALAAGAPLVVSRRVGFPIKTGAGSSWKYSKAVLFLAVSRFVAGTLDQRRVQVVYDGVPIPAESSRVSGRVVALESKPIQIPGVSVDHIRNLWEGLSQASVFVYKSEMEGLGSAALAAQAAGVPVVASGVGGLPEAVAHGETGFIVTDGDFAAPVRRLLDDPALAAKMGQAGRARVQREFTIDSMIEKTLAAYRDVLG
jgi:hypothetical protein